MRSNYILFNILVIKFNYIIIDNKSPHVLSFFFIHPNESNVFINLVFTSKIYIAYRANLMKWLSQVDVFKLFRLTHRNDIYILININHNIIYLLLITLMNV